MYSTSQVNIENRTGNYCNIRRIPRLLSMLLHGKCQIGSISQMLLGISSCLLNKLA